MTIKSNIKGRFLGGQGKDTVRYTNYTTDPTINGPDYPYVIAPNSVLEAQTRSVSADNGVGTGLGGIDAGHALHNLVGTHDYLPTDLNNGTIDLLNGAKMIETQDDDNLLDMIAFDKSGGTPAVQDVYCAVVGADGMIPSITPSDTLTPETVIVGGPAAFSTLMKTNILMWINFFVPGNTPIDWSTIADVGFDLGGARRSGVLTAGQDTNGSVMMQIGNGDELTSSAAYNDNTASGFDAVGAWFGSSVAQGRHTRMLAINPLTTSYAYLVDGDNGKPVSLGGNLFEFASGSAWVGNPAKGLQVNLGQDAPEGFGIYSMGVKNFDSDISEYEVKRASEFMNRTGLLPPWW